MVKNAKVSTIDEETEEACNDIVRLLVEMQFALIERDLPDESLSGLVFAAAATLAQTFKAAGATSAAIAKAFKAVGFWVEHPDRGPPYFLDMFSDRPGSSEK